ncbi:hypothetical protein ICL81_11675 [Leucobacter sp. cx-328]|uniref:DUF7455 domain-containing protein n=1 Tax=unclassified Leucobacter TaxID=2621730 RepID=UPI00165E8C44|nr:MULTISPECIES: hypothetical protein [unclassified Leucobacter]MBC9945153.1 hypothetical protein [Leucobacter sp. cx-328]MBC9954873.1 hypothetical protein [Leucobacter sp. cx-42]
MTTLEQNPSLNADATATDSAADRPLSALDRCDSCGAQAYVRAILGGSELLFCGHHAKRHEEKLRPMAEAWHDETSRLSETR